MSPEHERDGLPGTIGGSRLRAGDAARLGLAGLVARPSRAILSALAIAVGIAAMTSVVGISSSSQAQVSDELRRLGTNLLTVQAGPSITGEESVLPPRSIEKLRITRGVERSSGTGILADVHAYRSELSDPLETKGISVRVADLSLPGVAGATLHRGAWLNGSTSRYPAVVLGSAAARRLGVVSIGNQVWLGHEYFAVVGILRPVTLAPELDESVLLGRAVALARLGFDGHPERLYLRADESRIDDVRLRIPGTVNPVTPSEVRVSRPSDALAAKAATDQAFTGLLAGVGGIALLVGGIGIANTMIISVLERRREIGLRRALGARRGHIRVQFTIEALLLSACGGAVGCVIGVVAIGVVAGLQGWPFAPPVLLFPLSEVATLAIGAVAGLYPAIRAARTPPTAALNS